MGHLRGQENEGDCKGRPRVYPEEHGCADACCKVPLLAKKLEGGRLKNKKCSSKTKRNVAAPAHVRNEERRKRGRENVVAEVEKPRTEVAMRLRVAL